MYIFFFSPSALQSQVEQRKTLLTFFKDVSDERVKGRSLLHGDYILLSSTASTLAYLRSWDQSDCYIAAFNWNPTDKATLQLHHELLPEKATVVVSTNEEKMAHDQSINLLQLELEPQQAVLLKFPHVA